MIKELSNLDYILVTTDYNFSSSAFVFRSAYFHHLFILLFVINIFKHAGG